MHQKILVVQPLPGIGDALWFLPHLLALHHRYPAGQLVVLAKSASRMDDVLGKTIPLKKVLWLQRESGRHQGLKGFFRLVLDLKEQHCQMAWILHKSPRYALAARLAGIKIVYGYGLSYGRFLCRAPFLTAQELALHPIEQATALLQHHGVNTDNIQKSTLNVVPHLQKDIQTRYRIYPGTKILILGIGGSEVYKKWPAAFFAEVGKKFYDARHRVFILGGEQEKREALLIQALIREQGGDATAIFNLSIQESFALISQATLFVGNDTGMLNAAALLNIETFGFFAKTHPLAYRPNLHPLTPPTHIPNSTVGDISVDQVIAALGSFFDELNV